MTNAIIAAPAAGSNHARYDAAMDASRLLGGNFKLIRERKRKLAVDLVAASVVEGFALGDAIKDAKSAMRWTKLASDEQNQMNVLFNAVRVIDGAWKSLPEDVQRSFLAGERIFSTLAKEIKDAEKAALKAEAEAEDATEQAEAERAKPVNEDGTPKVEAAPCPVTEALRLATEWVGFIRTEGMDKALPEQLALLAKLCDAVDGFRADMAQPAKLANAA